MPQLKKTLRVINKLGLHARPATQFVDVANQFTSNITVYKGGDEPETADGKSVMQMIILAAVEGTDLEVTAEGDDAAAAIQALDSLFQSRFGEED
jgi:phosphocarrier protein HPr